MHSLKNQYYIINYITDHIYQFKFCSSFFLDLVYSENLSINNDITYIKNETMKELTKEIKQTAA